MKKLLLLLTCLPLLAADTTLIPANKPIKFAWDHEREDESVYYVLIENGTNTLRIWATNEVVITGTRTNVTATATNVISEIEATYSPGFERGTNSVTVIARTAFEPSDPSNVVPLKALGKPAAPSALRKP